MCINPEIPFQKRENKMMLSSFKANVRWPFCNHFQDCFVQWYLNVLVFLVGISDTCLYFHFVFCSTVLSKHANSNAVEFFFVGEGGELKCNTDRDGLQVKTFC